MFCYLYFDASNMDYYIFLPHDPHPKKQVYYIYG